MSNEYYYLPVRSDDNPNRVGFTRRKVADLTPNQKKYRETIEGLKLALGASFSKSPEAISVVNDYLNVEYPR